MFQDVAGLWGVLVHEVFYMHQFAAQKKSQLQAAIFAFSLGTAEPLPVLQPDKDEAQLLGDLRLGRQMLG